MESLESPSLTPLKWVAYASYPDQTLWRSRSDGTDRKQLTWPPMTAYYPSISPDGTRVSYHTDKGELFVVNIDGRTPERIDEKGAYASWSPDGNQLYYQLPAPGGGGGVIADLRTGKKSLVPLSEHKPGFWLSQETLLTRNIVETMKFQTFNLKTKKWTDFAPDSLGKNVLDWRQSPDGKYLYYTTGGAEPKVLRLRIADQRVETITSLKDLKRVDIFEVELSVAPDGSPILTPDTGYQEIYALNIRWP